MKKAVKPIVFAQGDKAFYRQNVLAQSLLLRAMSEGITDPHELRRIAALPKVADVFRTLDKLALRKEYHEALAKSGVSFEYIISGIKEVCNNSKSDATRLKGYQTLLRSIGLDKYEKLEDSGKSWEETIIQLAESNDALPSGEEAIEAEYEVARPEVPEAEKKKRKEEKELADDLYG